MTDAQPATTTPSGDAEEDALEYAVVLNDEEQYSIWPTDREVPAGWHLDGPRGTKQVCLAHIELVWTDMRPRSVRERAAAS
jgi:MbtH protein